MRTIAIVNENAISNLKHVVEQFKKSSAYDSMIVFTKDKQAVVNAIGADDVKIMCAPDSTQLDTAPKFRNWIARELKRMTGGWVHFVHDSIELLRDPADFMHDVENMMDALDINSFFGTVTDVCNRVYSKYNPRLKIALDNDEFKNFGFGNELLFCSHSNIHWTVCNLDRADDNELFFDEQFTVDMFFIIEFLARRRNTHPGSLYYMNQYATCRSELGTYRFRDDIHGPSRPDINEVMRREDALFKSKGINYQPDNNIDAVLENVYLKLKSKAG